MDEIKPLIQIRDAKLEDQAFIFSSFLKGLYYGNEWLRCIDKNTFMDKYKQILTHLIIKSQTKVACLESDPNTILGYAIYESGILHYVFIKPTFRKFGIAKQLIPDNIVYITHLTKIAKQLKKSGWKYDPWRI